MRITVLDYELEVDFISIPKKSLFDRLKQNDTKDISVFLTCEEGIGSTTGFGVGVPFKDYTKDEFIAAVKKQGEIRIRNMLQEQEAERFIWEKEEEKRNEENAFIQALGQKLSVPIVLRER